MKDKIAIMLTAEQLVIDRCLTEVTRDPPLVRAEIRAELQREILQFIDKKEEQNAQP